MVLLILDQSATPIEAEPLTFVRKLTTWQARTYYTCYPTNLPHGIFSKSVLMFEVLFVI